MAEKLIQALAKPFEPEAFHDEYQKKLLELVEAKGEGKQITGTPSARLAPVIDLMKALESSLAEVQRPAGTPAKKKAAARATKATEPVAIDAPKKRASRG